jgi:hypothetical protein
MDDYYILGRGATDERKENVRSTDPPPAVDIEKIEDR